MVMLTGEQYRASIRDGRAAYLAGQRIDDVTANPLLAVSVDWVARTYDQFHSGASGARNPMFTLPRSSADLAKQMEFLATRGLHGGDHRRLHGTARTVAGTRRDPQRVQNAPRDVSRSLRGRRSARGGRGRRRRHRDRRQSARGRNARRRRRAARRQTTRARRVGGARTVAGARRRGGRATRRSGDRMRGAAELARREDHQHHVGTRSGRRPALSGQPRIQRAGLLRAVRRRLRADRARVPERRNRFLRCAGRHARHLGTRAFRRRNGRARRAGARPRADHRRDERRREDRTHPQQAVDDRGVGVDVSRRLGPRARERHYNTVRNGAARTNRPYTPRRRTAANATTTC